MRSIIAKKFIVKFFRLELLMLALLLFVCISGAQAISQTDLNKEKVASELNKPVETVVVREHCSFEGVVTDAATGAPISGTQVSFFLGNHIHTQRTFTNDHGRYYLEVEPGHYYYTVRHPDHEIRSNAPETIEVVLPYTIRVGMAGGFYREQLVTWDSYKTVNIELDQRTSHVLLVSTTLLSKTATFDDTLAAYMDVLEDTEGLTVTYVEVDSLDCRDRFGVQVLDRNDWEHFKPVIRDIAASIGARTIILLGGEAVVPRPGQLVWIDDYIQWVQTDAWYVDMDYDQVVDPGWVISRMPDVSTASEAVEMALQSAIVLHHAGGYGMTREIRFSRSCWAPAPTGLGDACADTDIQCGTCYATPPYGVCDTCDMQESFFDLLSDHDYIHLSGHGSPTGFSTNDLEPIFNIDYMDEIDWQTHHPVITGHFSCNTGQLREYDPTMSTEFMRAGAAAFVARTLTEGTPSHFGSYFEDALKGETEAGSQRPYRIGDALFELMRESVLVQGPTHTHNAAQLVMVGDPTLRRSWIDRLTVPNSMLEVHSLPWSE